MNLSSRCIEQLLDKARDGDIAAGVTLLISQRRRLRNLISCRLHLSLVRIVDPSDLVQETLVDAGKRLPRYLSERPVPFFVWLRQLALDQVGKAVRKHLHTQKRGGRLVNHHELNDDSRSCLSRQLVDTLPGPEGQAMDEEQVERLMKAIQRLRPIYQSVIQLRYLELLSVTETAAALGLTQSNVKQTQLRALQTLRKLLAERGSGE